MSGPIGHDPIGRGLILSAGADFVHEIQPRSGVFPAGMEAWIKIWDSQMVGVLDTWNAVCTTTWVTWTIQSATADGIPENSRYRLFVQYPTAPSTEHLWFYGSIIRKQ